MLNNLPSIAVLLTCYNRKTKTLECLKTLFNQTDLEKKYNIEVFLVDDASTDGTGAVVLEKYPSVNVIKSKGNLYWSGGMHLAWQSAVDKNDYDFYLWLNDDIELFDDAIIEMLACHTIAGEESIICGSTCSKITGDFTYGGKSKAVKPIEPSRNLQECFYMNGNCVLISRYVFSKLSFIDPVFVHALGDYDYGLRAQTAGINVFVTRKFIAFCEVHEKPPEWCYVSTPLVKRFKSLYSPLSGAHPRYFFKYDKRHFGLIIALKHYLTIHLRALAPSLWK